MGEAVTPKEAERHILPRKWRSLFTVCRLLVLAYLLIIILFGLALSNASKLSSPRSIQANELFPCGSRTREWEYFDGRCYHFSARTATWQTAKYECETQNAHLVVIQDDAEQNFILSRTRGWTFWIGLSDLDVEGDWKWVDGTDYKTGFKNWNINEPNDLGHGEECVEILRTGWNDAYCNAFTYYVCEKPLSS